MSDPTTPTGKAAYPLLPDQVRRDILAIEAEAAAAERERLRAKWMELRPDEGWPPGWDKMTEAVMELLAEPSDD